MSRILFLAILAFASLNLAPASSNSPRPNIVLIFADDLGWKDVGYQGSDFYETPNIDRLAQEGLVFTDAYAAAGNCAPSRACLLSGTYSPRHHVYAVGRTDRGPKNLQRLVSVPNRSGLAKDNVILANALKTAGYATGIFGKWHLEGPEGAQPEEQGFDVVFDSQEGSPNQRRDRPTDPKGIFSITRAAGDFMATNSRAGKPFFAFVSHHAIHTALEARPASLAKFEAKAKGAQHHNALYAACTYDLDAGVGELLARLDTLGIAGNTLVVFTSDNGGTQQSSQEPLRGSKGGYYEGGIREPLIVRWPGVTKPGTSNTTPVINVDFYPTFLAAAGAPVPAGKLLDGESLLPLLRGDGALQRQSIFWHFPGYLDNPVRRGRPEDVRLGFRTRPVSVIRQSDWKLHLFHEEWVLDGGRAGLATNNAVELYQMRDDPGEHHNLALKHPARRDALLDDLLSWMKSVNALLPSQTNASYNPAQPGEGGRRARRQNSHD
jgi:arylsulfatase A-like enzyme